MWDTYQLFSTSAINLKYSFNFRNCKMRGNCESPTWRKCRMSCTIRVMPMWILCLGASGKEPSFQCRRHKRDRFDPWVRKMPLEEHLATHSGILAWRLMNRGAWWSTVHGVTKTRTWLKLLRILCGCDPFLKGYKLLEGQTPFLILLCLSSHLVQWLLEIH